MIVSLFNSSIVSGPESLVLPAMARSGWNVEVWFLIESRLKVDPLKDPVAYAEKLGLKVRVIHVNSRWDNQAIRALSNLIIESKPMLIHSHDVKASIYLGLASIRSRFFQAIKFFLATTHHGVRARFSFKLRLYERLYCLISALIFDHIYTVCTSDAILLKKTWFIPKHKIKLHLNGVTRHQVTSDQKIYLRKKYLQEWSEAVGQVFNSEALYIGVVGRLSYEKNHCFIIEVLNQLIVAQKNHKKFQTIYLLIFGSGPLEGLLKNQVQSLGLEKQILFLGYHSQMAEKIAALDVLLSFSLYEGLPINLIESGWAATPVIANSIDGNRDLLTNPNHGLLLENNLTMPELINKIMIFISDKEHLRLVGQAFQDYVREEFSEQKWIENLENYYLGLGLRSKELSL